MRLIKVENITEDQQLARPIFHKGNILLNKGVSGLDRFRRRLQGLGIRHIYVEDELSQGIEVNDVVKEETRQRGREVIKNTFEQITFNQDINIKEVKNIVGDIVDELFYRDEVLVNMVDIKSFNSYTFAHSVNVAVLSIILAKSLNYDKNRMRKLGIGAILHDIGKVLIPEDIIKKPGKLTEEEYNLIQKHPELGYCRVKDNLEISPLSRTVILKHHERVDGSGYPGGETGDKTHEFARIAGIADVFDALNSDRIYRDRWPINKIIN
ncbi:MAG: HD-GYP domain-containing protein, partial [Bacillota bacterium]